ncbi:hypothetical protein FGO68_gene11141 [Halteria grandinella]|uniref:Uncharacterized protein n=1 Tax=Halteria grandinella TaxID=5974 RepID=A0A8J8T9F3_HALGN|nr:hypothetical protein FGO68_gene11141 [Halteria grandinella]
MKAQELDVDVAFTEFLEGVLEVACLHVAGDVAYEETHIQSSVISYQLQYLALFRFKYQSRRIILLNFTPSQLKIKLINHAIKLL